MTPKEKAIDILATCRFALSIEGAPLGDKKDLIAKEFALIIVNKIIESLEDYDKSTEEHLKNELGIDYFSCELQNMDSDFRYWYAVKQEIEKL